MLRFTISLLFSVLLFVTQGCAQTRYNYKNETKDLYNTIQKEFYLSDINYYKESLNEKENKNKVSYLWPLCAMFEASNEMGKVTGHFDTFENIFTIIKKYHNKHAPAPGYASYSMEFGGGSRFYDDNQWIGITAMDAYFRTKDNRWLATGKEIYQFMMTGFDTLTGGGLYWQEDQKNSKNTCSNGPGVLLALRLYEATHQTTYS
ncbi:MAG: glycoside hydrolase family 76 protein [Niabella sp.]